MNMNVSPYIAEIMLKVFKYYKVMIYTEDYLNGKIMHVMLLSKKYVSFHHLSDILQMH